MLVLQVSYGGGLRRPSISVSNLFCSIVAALWLAAGTYRCRTGDLAMSWAAIVALGSAVTAANAWLSAFLLIAAFVALIMAELYSSSAALGPTIFVLMLFGGVSTTMTTMQSKSVIARVFGSSLALFDFQCLQSLLGFDLRSWLHKGHLFLPLVWQHCLLVMSLSVFLAWRRMAPPFMCCLLHRRIQDGCAWRHLQGFYCQQPLKSSSHVILIASNPVLSTAIMIASLLHTESWWSSDIEERRWCQQSPEASYGYLCCGVYRARANCRSGSNSS